MSKNPSSRQDKRQKFTNPKRAQAHKSHGLPRWPWLVLVTVVGLGLGVWAVNSASPASVTGAPSGVVTRAVPGSATTDQPAESVDPTPLAAAPVAATSGHEPYALVAPIDGQVRLPLSLFDDGAAHYFTYMNGAAPIEFFVLKSADGTVRAAYNACDVCFQAKRGYLQEGDMMVCQNCGRQFPSDQINVVEGGCNPAPLQRSIDGDMLVVKEGDIVLGARFF